VRIRQFFSVILCFAVVAHADVGDAPEQASAIIRQVLDNRAAKDFSLKARLFITRDEVRPLEILVRNTVDETRTIYRGEGLELLVVQPRAAAPRSYRRGLGELTGAKRMERVWNSSIACYDLGFGFLHWPKPKWVEEARTRGRTCDVIEVRAEGEPYLRVKMWIDREYRAVLRAEAYDADEAPVKRYMLTSVLRVGEMYVPRGMEFFHVPPGQALPAQERSRLEIYQGQYDARLPAEWFAEQNFQ